jgi:competence/damage-inducible protein CinA-like protein
MPAAELIAIGTELLLGEIQDTNTRYLARTLRDLGIDIYRATIVGDNTERIAQAIREAMARCQVIITTGGLGPTVDDPTRAAVALALDIDTEFRPELWEQIQARFSQYGRIPSDNNRRQAWIPLGAIPVHNPVGTAPAFICETINSCIISLPGVPREMEHLTQNAVIPYLRERFQLTGTIKARVLHVAGVGESQIDEWIGDLEINPNPTVGLLAHPGQVDIRITAKAESMEEADRLITDMETRVRERIPEGLFGVDQDTLEEAMLRALRDRGYSAVMVECGLGGTLRAKAERVRFSDQLIRVIGETCSMEELRDTLIGLKEEHSAEVALGISLLHTPEKHILSLIILSPEGEFETVRSFGGERALSAPWSVNTGLELLRRALTGELAR